MKNNVSIDHEFPPLKTSRPTREMSIYSEESIATTFSLQNFGVERLESSPTKSARTKQLKKNRNKKEIVADITQKDLAKLYKAIK